MDNWDVIVVGSGAGGLSAAVALANAGKKVLVLEQHYLPGGWTHSFTLEGYRFSPGVHYLGQLQQGGSLREVFEGLGVGAELEFHELNPDGYDHVIAGAERFDIPRGKQAFLDRLIARFPHERRGLKRYFRFMTGMDREFRRLASMPGPLATILMPLAAPRLTFRGLQPLSRIISRYISDPMLRTILEVRAGDHGMSPEFVPCAQHIVVEAHYWEGAWYPHGGGAAIPRAFIKRLRQQGGEIRLRTRVERILFDEQNAAPRTRGVVLQDGTEIRANCVISNADAHVTYQQLLDSQKLSVRLQKRLAGTEYSLTALSLFMATDLDLTAMGLDSGNYWLCRRPDVASGYRYAELPDLANAGPFEGLFVTVTTLKDPTKFQDGVHTLEAFTFVSYDAFTQWRGTITDERPDDYQAFKQTLTDRFMDSLEELIPGLRDRLLLCELGTPLSNEFYLNAHRGNLYGTAKTRSQVGPFGLPVKTEIAGLYHCGASTVAHGVMGALMSGLAVAKSILGCRTRDLLAHADEGTIRLHSANPPAATADAVEDEVLVGG